MRKLFLIITFALLSSSVRAEDVAMDKDTIVDMNNTPLATVYTDCDKLILSAQEAEVPLGNFFPDVRTAGRVSWCFRDKIRQKATEKQFELYQKAEKLMEEFLDDMLFYKGGHTIYCENAQLKYKFQSFIYFKLTGDKKFEIPEPDKLTCHLKQNLTEAPICLKEDILKICNIQTRRSVIYRLHVTSEATLELFKAITSDENTIQQWMAEYYNLVYRFVILIREDKDLMNPLLSSMFMYDWHIYEEMNGRELEEVSEVPNSYPIPFP